jgi:tRNA pseudouridine38-40 synthase
LLALVEYDGTDFAGFQLQAHPAPVPQPRTVQDELERAVAPLAGAPPGGAGPRVVGAGRTDAGVHAWGQVVHLDVDGTGPLAGDLPRFLRAWNARLPADVRVRALRPVPPYFHARYAARGRTYAYRIVNAPECSPLLRRYAHHVRAPLDLGAMREGARFLLGEHDFAPFAAQEGAGSARRTVARVSVAGVWAIPPVIWHTLSQWVAQPPAESCGPREAGPRARSAPADAPELEPDDFWASAGEPVGGAPRGPGGAPGAVRVVAIEVEANAFLRHMMRRIVGTLVEVGQGALPPAEVGAILNSGEKGRARQTAPARGLCLLHVRYHPDDLGPRAAGATEATRPDGH